MPVSCGSLPGEHDWFSWWATTKARGEIHHHEGSCLSLARDKWAQKKLVCICHGYTVLPFLVKHARLWRKMIDFILYYCCSLLTFSMRSEEKRGRERERACFLSVCIMDEACPQCSICGSPVAWWWPTGVTKDSSKLVCLSVCVTMSH